MAVSQQRGGAIERSDINYTIQIDNPNPRIGIVSDSYFQKTHNEAYPKDPPHNLHMAVYYESYRKGNVSYKGNEYSGNTGFIKYHMVKLEFDSEKGTLKFFLEGVQQPVYISGVKEKVHFFIFVYISFTTCILRSLKKIQAPTTEHIANEVAIQW
ncbi:MAG: hypothetical protein EZS28_049809 [Streblomastix strix]|uniref:SPRY domain-containing protein n=1 Tax=Streblomastix strix TaxID=222440 RepID=A0A5J4T8G3_9EUKA|nr:MAG: hypothetical protein EZS28_049809 [Streblomastix strix]